MGLFEEFLKDSGISERKLISIEEGAVALVDAAAEEALASRQAPADPEKALYIEFLEGTRPTALARRPV